MGFSLKNGIVYLLIGLSILAIFYAFFGSWRDTPSMDIVTVLQKAKNGEISQIEIRGDNLTVTTRDGRRYASYKESSVSMLKLLEDAGVRPDSSQFPKIVVQEPSRFGELSGLLYGLLPVLLFGGLLFLMMRQAQGANNQAFNFGKSRARLFGGNRPTVTFNDVAGVDEAKEELKEVVEFLKYPEKFAALGARVPKGVLLVGPPGTGKTLISKAVAGEAGVPFFSISGSEFVEMFVGVGASRVRDLFDQAKRNAPCIVFIDEIDAVGRQRGAGLGAGHDEREQTLNQILVEMDGFDTSTSVIVIAATNRPDILDPALLRPGRFDRQIVLDPPDVRGRKAILEVHCRGKPLAADVDLELLARQTPGFSGADLANLVNEAAILAARRDKKVIGMAEFEEAIDRVIAGPERKSRVISQREREITAYHEAGHALVGWVLPNCDPVHKISIVARGLMGGYTRFLPDEDRRLWTRSQFLDNLAAMLGGRAAEEVVFGEITTGAEDDIQKATRLARRMVTEFGMSDRLGPRTYGKREGLIFLGRDMNEIRNYSEKIAEEIDAEVDRLILEAHHRAREILLANRPKLDRLAAHLVAHETVEGETLRRLLAEGPVEPEGSRAAAD
ncbi:MAG: cell division protein FtsH [Chloroflexota bacterium]